MDVEPLHRTLMRSGMGFQPVKHRQDADATRPHGQDAHATLNRAFTHVLTFSRFSFSRAAVLLSALLWLGGCSGPATVVTLRQHPEHIHTFEVPADCPTVYLRIARRAQERYRHTSVVTYQPGVTTRLAADRQSASVTFFNAGGFGLEYLLTADLRALDPARTEVTAYCANRGAAKEALLWQQWANTPLDNSAEPSAPREDDPKDVNDLMSFDEPTR